MDCLNPIRIENNGQHFLVPCGHCYACLSRKRMDWSFRLAQEQKNSCGSYFITLTYSDDHIPRNKNGVPVVLKQDVQRFIKNVRETLGYRTVRYFCVSEYGPTTFRPHYHMLLFNIPPGTDITGVLGRAWKKGFFEVGNVTSDRIGYCAKYCLCTVALPERIDVKPFMLCSRRPAIGSSYLSPQIARWHYDNKANYVINNGVKVHLPRYYKDKLFVENDIKDEIQKLNDAANKERIDRYLTAFFDYDLHALRTGGLDMSEQQKDDFCRRVYNKLVKQSKL